MPSLTFDGETHGEIVQKVRRWLASIEGAEEGDLSVAEAISRGAELTKDALRIIASAAPSPVAESDIVKGLTALGYQATDATAKALVDALDGLSSVTGGGVVRKLGDGVIGAGEDALFEMSSAVAKQVLKGMRPKKG
jgi:hypothetical protein